MENSLDVLSRINGYTSWYSKNMEIKLKNNKIQIKIFKELIYYKWKKSLSKNKDINFLSESYKDR
jgi:hypothetical protein